MAKYVLSAFADEYSSSLDIQLEALKSFEITHTELRFADNKNIADYSDEDVCRLQKMLEKYGIKVNSIGSPLGKIKIDDDIEAHLEKTERVCSIASALNSPFVRIFSFYPPDGKNIHDYKDQIFSSLEKMIDIAEKYNVRLCHENEAKIYGEQPERCLELLEYFKGRLGCVFDMGNFALEGYDSMAAFEKLCPYIDYFHIKDALGAGAIVPPGCGEARIADILSLYKNKYNKDTFVTLEPHLQTFSGLNALTDRTFDNPYKYDTLQDAFTDAVNKMKDVLKQI